MPEVRHNTAPDESRGPTLSAAELGALAHLYRGEMYRSKIWRTRLDTTTNWAVGTTGIALSLTFSNANNSPLPLVLVSMLVIVFMIIEARRYCYFDIWRARVRMMEVDLFGPILRGKGVQMSNRWNDVLANNYAHLHFNISFWEALGRRMRRNYLWIFAVLGASYVTKLIVHPTPLSSWNEFWARAAIGPIDGRYVIAGVAGLALGLIVTAFVTLRLQAAAGRVSWVTEGEGGLWSLPRRIHSDLDLDEHIRQHGVDDD